MSVTLVHPNANKRREATKRIATEVEGLKEARTLPQVAQHLVRVHEGVLASAQLHGINLKPLLKQRPCSVRDIKRVLRKSKNPELVEAVMPGRAGYNNIKDAILTYAQRHNYFTVDRLLAEVEDLAHVPRRSLKSNLYSMAKRGLLKRAGSGVKGRKGSPALYCL